MDKIEKMVSIVLPVYNGEDYIEEAVESVLAQSYKNWELLIVNDCSTDRTGELAEAYARRDPRIRVICNEENQRLPRSLNIGFRQAKGDLFTWTSDDNRYKETAIAVMAGFLEENPDCGFVCCDMEYIDEAGKVTGKASIGVKGLSSDNPIGACFLYTRQAAECAGEYDPDMFLVEDYDYWIRLSKGCRLCHIPQCLYQYRFHGGSLTMTRDSQIQKQLFRLRMRELDYLISRGEEEERELLFVGLWSYHRETANQLRKRFFGSESLPESLRWLERIDRGGFAMDKAKGIILFGAGLYGRKALGHYGQERVSFFADNNKELAGKEVEGKTVLSFDQLKQLHQDYQIVISVASKTAPALARQLEEAGIHEYVLFAEMLRDMKAEAAENGGNCGDVFPKAVKWIQENTISGKGIINSTNLPEPYPEVAGYYIPTLLRWGFRDLALTYAKWLCGIQKPDGSWYDTMDQHPYVFDTAQILKGLLAVRELYPQADGHIRQGCDWILSNIQADGHLTTPDQSQWNSQECSDLIHLYCLEPLYTAAKAFGEERYRREADRVKMYYLENRMDEIMGFGMLSHFYAYVMEALCDIGETELAQKAMEGVAALQRENGMVPAYRDVNWVCSTGLFQFALVWYKLGELEKGNKAFRYACSLQNASGGWYGGYATKANAGVLEEKEYATYFSDGEISWAVKYFLDALSAKCRLEFERQAPSFFDSIAKTDGRYQAVLAEIGETVETVCDVGCGKGNYLRNLLEDTAAGKIRFFCTDISWQVMRKVPEQVEKRQGTLTCIPYPDNSFDITYTAEALEHAICLENAVKELLRVTKPGGKVVVVDKNLGAKGALETEEWERWFDDAFFEKMAEENGCRLTVRGNLPYENGRQDGLFSGWILHKP